MDRLGGCTDTAVVAENVDRLGGCVDTAVVAENVDRLGGCTLTLTVGGENNLSLRSQGSKIYHCYRFHIGT